MYVDEDLLMISGLQHIAFCERQWALIHLEQQWGESIDTVRGDAFHSRVHMEGYSVSGKVLSERGVRLVSYRLGLIGVADVVEFEQIHKDVDDGTEESVRIQPVEYKVGKPKIEDWDRIQVCAQALCLEEMYGHRVETGFLFYGKTRRREAVELNSSFKKQVVALAERMHELYSLRVTPRPMKTAKCKRCSLRDCCLPEAMTRSASIYWNEPRLRQDSGSMK